METPSASMNRLLKNKYFQVFLVTSFITALYLSFGFFRSLWPYQNWFKAVSATYALSLLLFFVLVVASNVYSLIALILAKVKKKEVNPLVTMGPTISFTILVGFALAPSMPKFLPSGSHIQVFDSDSWIGEDSMESKGGITTRQKMLGDVVENILPGRTRNEIIRLLGLSSDDSNQPALLYFLGPARGDFFGVEVEWLNIYFDPSGHYEKYVIFRED